MTEQIIKATFQKISKNENAISSELFEGYITNLPEFGAAFYFNVSDATFTMDSFRYIRTSLVASFKQEGNVITINTLNSVYELKLL